MRHECGEIYKIGGSLFKKPNDIRKAALIFKKRFEEGRSLGESTPVVIVSALFNVTNLLEEACGGVLRGDCEAATYIINSLIRRHEYAFSSLGLGGRERATVEVLEKLKGLSPGENDREFMDLFLASGEVASGPLFTETLIRLGVRAKYIDAREVVVTDGNHTNAEPDWESTRAQAMRLILPWIQQGIVPVMPGFIGRSRTGATTTVGREGSDFIATLIAWALKASKVHKWVNVGGIYDKDPKKHRDAKIIPHLSFAKADKFAHRGGMIHPRTIKPLLEGRIPLEVWNIDNMERPGTRISD